jgi:chitin deacetylase
MPYALTFDDGPGPSMPALLDVLKEADVRATFFVLGCNLHEPAWGTPEVARAMVVRALREGHVLGNHSYSHARTMAPGAFMDEVRRMDDVLRELRREAGLPEGPILVRLPYGEQGDDDVRARALRNAGRVPIGWTGELFHDWLPRDPVTLCVDLVERAAGSERKGDTCVLTLHASGESAEVGFERPWTVEAVRLFLVEAQRRGWKDEDCPGD